MTVLNSDCGLSQQDCECILQDKKGFIWIGTYDGLNRFDGRNVETFRHNPSRPNSIADNRIISFAEWVERDELWIGTDGGMSIYDMSTGEFTSTDDYPALNGNYISCFMRDGQKMWAGTVGGMFRISVDESDCLAVEQFPLFDGHRKIAPAIQSIERDDEGNVYVSSDYNMYVKSADSNVFVKQVSFPALIRQIYTDKRGQMWIVTQKSLYRYDPSTSSCMEPVGLHDYISGNEWLCKLVSVTDNMYLLLASRSLYWITVSNGEYTVEPVCFIDDSFWKDNVMKTVMIDNALNIWVTSAGDGVARFDLNSKTISHYNRKSDQKTYIQKIFADKRKRMWIATNENISMIPSGGGEPIILPGITEGVYDIYETASGIWLSSLTHIYYMKDGEIGNIKEIRQLPEFAGSGIGILGPYAITGNGDDTVWIGMRNGILKIKQSGDRFSFDLNNVMPPRPIQLHNNITSLLFMDRDGSDPAMFVGTKNTGLLKCGIASNGDIINLEPVRQAAPECGNHIWSVTKMASGRIYVGTDCGLRELTVDSEGSCALVKVCDDERINTYKVMSVVEDGKNNLWLNTSQGLLKYSVNSNETVVIRASDGLSSNVLCEGALYDGECNLLYVGGIKGIDVLDLNSLQGNNILPVTQITAISVNNTPVRAGEDFNGRVLLSRTPEYTETLDLEYYENNFTIGFASMHFSNPDKNTYLYKLEGFDDNWTTVDNNIHSATFTNVPPGRYLFKVKSANCDGLFGNDERIMAIDIGTPLYRSWGAIAVYILLGIASVYSVIRYFSHRQRKRREDLMRQMDHKKEMEIAEAKISYNTNITHELRTPLSLIISPLDELLSKRYSDEFLESRLKMIKANTDSLLMLISQFLDFRKVVNEKMNLKIRRERLSELLSEIIRTFAVSAEQKGIVLEFCDDLQFDTCWCDRDIIKKICSNLLSNAIKYSPEGSHVILHACTTNTNYVQISVEDNGIGISEKDCEKIFDRFYQVPGTIGGTGIGLNLCKSLAQIHKGTIGVVSHEGEGSIFTFEFPASQSEYTSEIVDTNVLPSSQPVNEAPAYIGEPDLVVTADKKVVLIIEDNVELRNYVAQLLQQDYKIITAGNGQEGLDMTIDYIPDIVVCDIMMPIMDGIEYTRKVRQDIRTSHIPIILLTAKVAVESEIEGLSYGADDYIMKPFNPQVLKLRIENLLKLTSVKAQNASKEVDGDSSVPSMNERERNFVETLRKLVTDNMSVPGYGMDDICGAMGMSRMQLHRKITAILNQKPSQFVKEVKMKRAYSLLKEKGLNITETMYEVGYSNYSYFSKLFVEVHGISPRELLGMRTREDKP